MMSKKSKKKQSRLCYKAKQTYLATHRGAKRAVLAVAHTILMPTGSCAKTQGVRRMQIIHQRCCGLNIHKKTVVAFKKRFSRQNEARITGSGKQQYAYQPPTTDSLSLRDYPVSFYLPIRYYFFYPFSPLIPLTIPLVALSIYRF